MDDRPSQQIQQPSPGTQFRQYPPVKQFRVTVRDSVRSIQFLRSVAATLVVVEHSIEAINVYFGQNVVGSILYFTDAGGVGVHIFFVISGFIMIYTSFGGERSQFSSSRFLARRFIRIYPVYWLYGVTYVLFHQLAGTPYNLSIWDMFKSLLLLPGYSSLIIGPGWTLSFEVYFYICFGFFMTLGLPRGLILMSLFFIASIAIGTQIHPSNAGLHVGTDPLLLEFLAGAWIAYYLISGKTLTTVQSRVCLLLALSIFAASLAFGYGRVPSIFTWGVPSALLIAGAVFTERVGDLPRLVREYSFLGNSSYSLYLLHILMIDIFLRSLIAVFPHSIFGFIAICLLLTLLCALVALLFYEFIERKLVNSLQAALRTVSTPAITTKAG